jgi:hemoglobin
MKNDINSRGDVERLVTKFYEKVIADPLIGPIFTEVVQVNWEKHLPVMFNFWENALFYTGNYSGNPMMSHQRLNEIFPLQEQHFNQWVLLFTETVDELFEGEKANLAKQKALSISTILRIKILKESKEGLI